VSYLLLGRASVDRLVAGLVGAVVGGVLVAAVILLTDPAARDAETAKKDTAAALAALGKAESEIKRLKAEAESKPVDPIPVDVAEPTATPSVAAPSVPTPLKVSAVDLYKAYMDNEIAADESYSGHVVRVDGEINDVGRDILGTPYVAIKAGDESLGIVQCLFESDSEVASLSRGEDVAIVGTVSSKTIGVVIVRDCKVVSGW
jgi:hypothetical protein